MVSRQEYWGVLRDVSMVGARVLLDASMDIPFGSQLSLSMILPDNTLRVSGKVVWTKDAGGRREIGMFFVNIPDSCKENLYNCIFKYYKNEIVRRWWQI